MDLAQQQVRRGFGLLATLVWMILTAAPAAAAEPSGHTLHLQLRSRVETSKGSGRYHTLTHAETWDARHTAVIICDVWDLHHCLNAVRRIKEFAPRLNRFVSEARTRGAVIIHAPSECMDAYRTHPARLHALSVPRAHDLPKDIGTWCNRIPAEERGRYPIDQADGGEDDDPIEHAAWADHLRRLGRNPKAPWKKESDLLTIAPGDYLSDKGDEIWSILQQRGIQQVILAGVHANMCVLGRPFGLRQMAKNGKKVVLVRDLTDTMYNPKSWPHVSHFTGTDLIVEHIEKFVCPTITSDQLLGGRPFRFAHDTRPHVVILMAEDEYKTDETLPAFAANYLNRDFRVSLVFDRASDRDDLPGLEVLKDADVLLLSVRRRLLRPEQMALIRGFIRAGKPVIGIRTACHAFGLRSGPPPAGHVAWVSFDREVLGGNYHNHYGNTGPRAEPTLVRVAAKAGRSPLLNGVRRDEFPVRSSLYRMNPLEPGTELLMTGHISDHPPEPVAWIFTRRDGGRSFYTSLGHPDDFTQPAFQHLLRNAVYWAAGLPVPAK